jgi:hypothetical protein
MKHLLAPTGIIATVAILFAAITPAHACSCAQISVEDSVANANIVAIATVTRMVSAPELRGDAGVQDSDGLASVERYLKGSGPAEITIDDPVGDGDCGFLDETHVGERHLFFLTTDDGAYKTHLCAGNALLTGEFVDEPTVNAYVAEVEAITGSGQAPNDVQPTDPPVGDGSFPINQTEVGVVQTLEDDALQLTPADADDLPREAFWALAIVLPFVFLAAATLVASRRP